MSGFITSLRAASVAVLLLAPAAFAGAKAPASQPQPASCCATQTRCCPKSSVKHCCDEPAKAACCKTKTACCGMKGCCGPQKQKVAACNVTGKPQAQCCPSKAVPMPPCCMKSCDTPVHA